MYKDPVKSTRALDLSKLDTVEIDRTAKRINARAQNATASPAVNNSVLEGTLLKRKTDEENDSVLNSATERKNPDDILNLGASIPASIIEDNKFNSKEQMLVYEPSEDNEKEQQDSANKMQV